MSIEIIVALVSLFGVILTAVVGFKQAAKQIHNKTLLKKELNGLIKLEKIIQNDEMIQLSAYKVGEILKKKNQILLLLKNGKNH